MGPFKTLLDFGNKPYDDTIRHNFDHQSENDGSVILFPVPLLYKLGEGVFSQISHVRLCGKGTCYLDIVTYSTI